MRIRATSADGALTVHAIAGSHVVTFGLDWPEARAGELQGFALHRTDHSTGRADWIEAQKRYLSTDPGTRRGERVSTRQHPVQAFLWADYTARADRSYTYRVVALGGTPAALTELADVTVEVRTTSATKSGHGVHFNRGAVAAQEYARRFDNRLPDEVGAAAEEWLSHGLLESLVAFVDRAAAGDALHVAIYEARHDAPLEALARARARGVDVKIVFDAKDNGDAEDPPFPRDENHDFLSRHALLDVATPRETNPSFIAHNKFVVRSTGDAATEVWTGSTNWSDNAFFGQLNVGHEVTDAAVAAKFLAYWELLAGDPSGEALRPELAALTPLPDPFPAGATMVFSPQPGRAALDRYVGAAKGASVVLVTLAFSIDDALGQVLGTESDGLRYVLMDGIKGNDTQRAKMEATVTAIRKTEAGRVAMGAFLRSNAMDQFLRERFNGMSKHVPFVHTKFMILDPLGPSPIVITGSANFSDASSNKNDENMLVLVDDADVADIYLGEFMRSYSHYAFRDAVESARKSGREFDPKPLNEDRSWSAEHYGDGFKSRQRSYFAQGKVAP